MQGLANYDLCHESDDDSAKAFGAACIRAVDGWLKTKGDRAGDGQLALHRGGRLARLDARRYISARGEVREWHLTEPLERNPGGEFKTTVQLAIYGKQVHAYLALKAGYAETRLAPEMQPTVNPPVVLRDLQAVTQLAGTAFAPW